MLITKIYDENISNTNDPVIITMNSDKVEVIIFYKVKVIIFYKVRIVYSL